MPIRSFVCPTCGTFELILNRLSFDNVLFSRCPECEAVVPAATYEIPSRRNPAHGLQQ